MPELSIGNIDQIISDVRGQEITFSHLLDDLIDHICCDVEYEMQKGISFSDAYRKVRLKMGSGRRLKEIQEETLYAVDTKYRKMKNTMKISGVAGTILFGFAALFKIMHWPLAGMLMTMGAITLAFVFMPSALGVLWKETHSSKRLFLFISAFFAAMFFIVGILFKVQHWPGAGPIMLLAGASAVLFFIPSLIYNTFRNPENKDKRPVYLLGAIGTMFYIAGFFFKIQHWPLAGAMITLGLILLFGFAFPWYVWVAFKNESFIKAEFIYLVAGSLALIIPSAMTLTNIQRNFEGGYFNNAARQSAMNEYLAESNAALIRQYSDSAVFPKLEDLHSIAGKVTEAINLLEAKMIAETEGKQGMPAENLQQVSVTEESQPIDYLNISDPFNPAPVSDFLLPGTVSRSQLEATLADYKKYLSGIIPATDLAGLEKALDPSAYLPVPAEENRNISMMAGLNSLALMKNALLTVENTMIRKIACSK